MLKVSLKHCRFGLGQAKSYCLFSLIQTSFYDDLTSFFKVEKFKQNNFSRFLCLLKGLFILCLFMRRQFEEESVGSRLTDEGLASQRLDLQPLLQWTVCPPAVHSISRDTKQTRGKALDYIKKYRLTGV